MIKKGLSEGKIKASHTSIARELPLGRPRPSDGLLAKVKSPYKNEAESRIAARLSAEGPRAIEPPKAAVIKGRAEPVGYIDRPKSIDLDALKKRFKAEKAMKKKPWTPLKYYPVM